MHLTKPTLTRIQQALNVYGIHVAVTGDVTAETRQGYLDWSVRNLPESLPFFPTRDSQVSTKLLDLIKVPTCVGVPQQPQYVDPVKVEQLEHTKAAVESIADSSLEQQKSEPTASGDHASQTSAVGTDSKVIETATKPKSKKAC
jgi:hypothetical protein